MICYDKSHTKSPTIDLYGVDTPNTRTPYTYDSPIKPKMAPISQSANPVMRSSKNTPLSVDIDHEPQLQKQSTLHVPSPFDGKKNVRSHRAASNPGTADKVTLNRQPSDQTQSSITQEYDFSLMIEEIPQTPMPMMPNKISINAPQIKLSLEGLHSAPLRESEVIAYARNKRRHRAKSRDMI
eukprot:UN12433